jgi:glycosyltransferase involved in cell wall biosynthesis
MIVQPVSVIIPTFNRKSFLTRALNSVQNQTCRCAEIIIVDDGSTDGTEEYLESFKSQSSLPVHYFKQSNKGPAAARNLGIAHSACKYITFLDSDDHWHKRKIEKQLQVMLQQPEYMISHTRERWMRNGVHINQKKKHLPKHGYIFSHCLDICTVSMSTVMVKRELFDLIGTFDQQFRCCEDYDFWLRVSCRYPFLLVDDTLTVKEGGRGDQVSAQYQVGMHKLHIQALDKLLKLELLDVLQVGQAERELLKKALIYGNGCVRHGRVEEGQRYLQLAASLQDKFFESCE